MVKMNNKDGKMARKKLNEMAAALEEMYPSYKPFMKNLATVYKESPSKPGKTTLFDWFIKEPNGLKRINL